MLPFLPVFGVLAALMMLWALATPLMASPDEQAHAIKAAAVVGGQPLGIQGEGQGAATTVDVPGYIAQLPTQTCFRFLPDRTADCATGVDDAATAPTTATTTAGNYNPVYYSVVGLPTLGLAGEPAVYGMRLVSAILCAAALAAAVRAASLLRSARWAVTGLTVGITPMVLFLGASINPNALEIVTTAAFFTNLAVGIEMRTRAMGPYGAHLMTASVAACLLANTRALSLLWLACAALVIVLIYGRSAMVTVFRTPAGLVSVALAAVASAFSLAWLVYADSFSSLTGEPSGVTPEQAFMTMIGRAVTMSREYIGVLGWLDTFLPDGVYVFWTFLMSAVLLAGVALTRGWPRAAVAGLVAVVVVLPAVLQARVISDLGYIWQGRYILALVVLLLIVSGVAQRDTPFPGGKRARRLVPWLLGLLVVCHLYAFVYVLRRYTVGLNGRVNWTEMFASPWQPPLGWPTLSLAYLAVLLLAAWALRRWLAGPEAGRLSPEADREVTGSTAAVRRRPGA